MRCKFISKKGTWREVANSARTTIGLEAGKGEPSSIWKKRILLAEHSPIRQLWIKAKWYDIKSWTSVHFVRHWLGIVHWVKSQRPDRRDKSAPNRDKEPQDTPINHEFDVNAQAVINISRRRLCNMVMSETKEAWQAFLDTIKNKEPEIFSVAVPDCIYRGWCYEYVSCGWYLTLDYQIKLKEYREGIRE